MNTCCDHMASEDGFLFCDLNREFPFECRCCAAWITDTDPTHERSRIWHLHIAGPAQTQADSSVTRESGSSNAV